MLSRVCCQQQLVGVWHQVRWKLKKALKGRHALRESPLPFLADQQNVENRYIGHDTRCANCSQTPRREHCLVNVLIPHADVQDSGIYVRVIYPTIFSLFLDAHFFIISSYSVHIYSHSRKKSTRSVNLCCSLGLYLYEHSRHAMSGIHVYIRTYSGIYLVCTRYSGIIPGIQRQQYSVLAAVANHLTVEIPESKS